MLTFQFKYFQRVDVICQRTKTISHLSKFGAPLYTLNIMTSEIVVMYSVYMIYFAIHVDTKTLKTCTYFP